MSSPVRLSRSRRILSRSGSRPSVRSNSSSSPSSSSSSSSKFATPHASVDNDSDDSPNPRVRRSPSPSRSRRSRASTKSASRRRSISRSTDGAPGDVLEIRHASPTRLRPHKQTRFGIPAPTNQPRIIGNFDFEEKYPEDPIYEELGPNARVWRANLDECEVFDNDMVTEARDGLDLMLVFAGLFSAVLTTFVAQTSQALSNNFPAVSTALLLEMVTLQRALINGTSIDNVAASEMTSGPSGFDIWVNVLWFTSLTLSLGTALMAVLVKQWLYQYMSIISGTARDRSLVRFYRFDGLRKWHVLTIIGTLPIVLHIALGLFLAGLVIFLVPLNIPLAIIVGFITLVIYSIYAISNILPIMYAQCPYRTPFSDILNVMLYPMRTFLSSARGFRGVGFLVRTFSVSAVAVSEELRHFIHLVDTFLMSAMVAAVARIHKFIPSSSPSDTHSAPKALFRTLKEAERIAATGDNVAEEIAADALSWLYQVTSNTPTKNVVLHSIGCLSDNVTGRLTAISADIDDALDGIRQSVNGSPNYWSILQGQEIRAERLLRANRHNANPSVRDYQLWMLPSSEASERSFHLSLSILTYSPSHKTWIEFPIEEGYDSWDCVLFLVHILQGANADSIIFPSLLWQRLFDGYQLGGGGLTELDLYKLIQLALQSLRRDDDMQTDKPFSGGVPITHYTVPLFDFAANVLPRPVYGSSIVCERLLQLLTINDFIVSRSFGLNIHESDLPSAFREVWSQVDALPQLSPGDCRVLCHQAEELILRVFVDVRLSGVSRDMHACYRIILRIYRKHDGIPSQEFFKRLLFESCFEWSLRLVAVDISSVLGDLLDQVRDPAFFILILESPLFPPGTTVLPVYDCCRLVYPILSGFVAGLARGTLPPEVTLQCMDYLCADPDRLFTVCRVLALGGEKKGDSPEHRDILVQFAAIAPNRAAWKARADYMSVDPLDWPHFRLTDDGFRGAMDRSVRLLTLSWVRDRMKVALVILDTYFDSLNNHSTPSEVEPSVMSSVGVHISPRKRVRHVVTSFRCASRPNNTTTTVESNSPPVPGTTQATRHPSSPTITPLSRRLRNALSNTPSFTNSISLSSASGPDAPTENVV